MADKVCGDCGGPVTDDMTTTKTMGNVTLPICDDCALKALEDEERDAEAESEAK